MTAQKFLSELEKTVSNKKVKTAIFLIHSINNLKKKYKTDQNTKIIDTLIDGIKPKPIGELRDELFNRIYKFKQDKKLAEETIINLTSQKIKRGSTVFVYGYSSRILSALKLAKKKGINFSVYTADSGPEQYGKKTHEEITKININVKHFPDILITNALEKTDIILFV